METFDFSPANCTLRNHCIRGLPACVEALCYDAYLTVAPGRELRLYRRENFSNAMSLLTSLSDGGRIARFLASNAQWISSAKELAYALSTERWAMGTPIDARKNVQIVLIGRGEYVEIRFLSDENGKIIE